MQRLENEFVCFEAELDISDLWSGLWLENEFVYNFHDNDKIWHMSIHCIVFDLWSKTGVLLDAMNDINWYALNFGLIISLPS